MDICATTAVPFVARDSNPGTVRTSPGGVGRNIAHNLALLGDKVELVTVFGDDGFGRMLREHCAAAGIGTKYSQTVKGARNACFVSVNDSDGELLGGVADMAVTGLMTPEWLERRMNAINGADARSYASQGQTRTAALSIKLAEREIFLSETGETPVLLLDDVLSELDAARQEFVLNRIGGGQTLVTCCEAESVARLLSGRVMTMEQGAVR